MYVLPLPLRWLSFSSVFSYVEWNRGGRGAAFSFWNDELARRKVARRLKRLAKTVLNTLARWSIVISIAASFNCLFFFFFLLVSSNLSRILYKSKRWDFYNNKFLRSFEKKEKKTRSSLSRKILNSVWTRCYPSRPLLFSRQMSLDSAVILSL